MLDFISKDVREYMERNGLKFTDFEKAALIFHSGLPILKRLELLEQLAGKTEDSSLRKQILAWLASDRQDLEAFRNNTEGYVFAVGLREGDDDICGYFATADMAYAHGMKQGCKFRIEKYLIVGFNGREPKKSKVYFNPNLMNGADMKECVTVTEHDYFGGSEAEAHYDKDGTLEFFWSSEIERNDEEIISRSYDPKRFENAFIYIPNPFERGDIVRLTTDGGHGIVATSQREWKEFLERVKSGMAKWVDFYDASITVDFLQDNGSIMHSHICPAFLEKFEPQKGDVDYDVLTAAKEVHQGECTFDYFLYCLDEYRKQLIFQRPGGGVPAQKTVKL